MFLARTAEALDDLTTIDEKLARYEANPSPGDAAKLGRYYDARSEYKEALGYYQAAQNMNTNPDVDYSMAIFETTYYGFRKDMFDFEQLTANADAVYASDKVDAENLILAARMMVYASKKSEEPTRVISYLKEAVARTEGSSDESVQKGRQKLMPDYALLVLEDPVQAVAHKKAGMAEGWREDAGSLNSFAWWCFENNVNLEEAQALAEKGVELAPAGAEKAMILDTLAEICNARDDCHRAVEIIKRAIQEDPEKEFYKEQLERFQTLLAEKQGKP